MNPSAPWPSQLLGDRSASGTRVHPTPSHPELLRPHGAAPGFGVHPRRQHPRRQQRCQGTLPPRALTNTAASCPRPPAPITPTLSPGLALPSRAAADAVPAAETKRPEPGAGTSPVQRGCIPHYPSLKPLCSPAAGRGLVPPASRRERAGDLSRVQAELWVSCSQPFILQNIKKFQLFCP